MNTAKIVIAGAGFGGISAGLQILKTIPNAQLTVINSTPFHSYHLDLYETVGISFNLSDAGLTGKLKSLIDIPLEKIFPKSTNLVIAEIEEIDLPQRIVTAGGKKYEYDFLISALGSNTCYYGITGAQEFSYQLKTAADALNIRAKLAEKIELTDRGTNVVIAGGGFSGVELAGSLVQFLKKSAKHSGNHASILLEVIEGTDNVLPGMRPEVRDRIKKRLEGLGVKFYFNSLIAKVEKNSITCQDGQKITYDVLIWTTGVEGNPAQKLNGATLTKKKQIEVAEDLSLAHFPEVFIIGDAAEFINPQTSRPVPATAWAAIGEGQLAAENIKRRINRQNLKKYTPEEPIFVVPAGGFYAIAVFGSFLVPGFLGWTIKRGVALKYFLSILPPLSAFKLWLKALSLYFRNDLT